MKWENQERSSNVEDRRRGGIGGTDLGGCSTGLGSVGVAPVAGWIFGINSLTLLGMTAADGGSARQAQQSPAATPPVGDREAPFVSTVLGGTEVVCGGLLQSHPVGLRNSSNRHQHG